MSIDEYLFIVELFIDEVKSELFVVLVVGYLYCSLILSDRIVIMW